MQRRTLTALLFLLLPLIPACQSCDPAQPPGVSELLELIKGATTETLDKEKQDRGYDGGADRFKVAVTPVICTGEVDLSSNRGAFQDGISRAVSNSKLFLPINADVVARAMEVAGIATAADLNLDAPRQRFLSQMKSQGHLPAYWIFAKVNTLKTVEQGCMIELLTELDLRMVNTTDNLETSPGVKQILKKGSL